MERAVWRWEKILLVLAAVLAASGFSAALLSGFWQRSQFTLLSQICGQITERAPEAETAVLAALKGYAAGGGADFLEDLGYKAADFGQETWREAALFSAGIILAGSALLGLAVWRGKQRRREKIWAMTRYLERVNRGKGELLLGSEEDEFSHLRDEIYKTVTELSKTRDQAVAARQAFADNLANIAHQLKTPITAISLAAQMGEGIMAERIMGQAKRLSRLEEALLLLSRIDAGTLVLAREPVDVFSLLNLAADNLEEVFSQMGIFVDIPEGKAISVQADLGWTMEAVMNLMKNCGEHTPAGGRVCCAYEEDLLYTSIQIWDEGPGFDREELPHLFERFYRGKRAASGGVGIGLALARAVVELQNGIILAYNRPEGGGCFEIRFYHT